MLIVLKKVDNTFKLKFTFRLHRTMDRLESLRFFIDIAEAGSFSAVARSRAVAVSTVTLALQRLEAELGVSLITRSTRRLSLTHDGERFLNDARRLLADWDTAVGGLHQQAMLSTLAYSPCEPYGKRVKWRSLSH